MTGQPRAWVIATLADRCAVCRRNGDVLLWPVGAPELTAPVPCPHCGPLNLPIALHPRGRRRDDY